MGKVYVCILLSLAFLTSCWDDQGKNFSLSEVESGAFSITQEAELNSLYAKYVNASSEVDYEKWQQNESDMQAVKELTSSIARAAVSAMDPAEAKSFYINAYNILTIDLILRNYSETLGDRLSPYPGKRSIRNIDRLDAKVWDDFKWIVGGRRVSLNDIEHKILRPQGDARIHFALVCASKGCPPLHNKAFSSQNLEDALNELATKFVNSGRDTRLAANGSIEVSSILSWFEDDFKNHFGSVRNFLKNYARPDLLRSLETASITYRTYDWTLNDGPSSTGEDDEDVGSGSESDEPEVGSGSESDEPEVGSGSESDEPEVGSGSESDEPEVGSDSESDEPEVGSGSEKAVR